MIVDGDRGFSKQNPLPCVRSARPDHRLAMDDVPSSICKRHGETATYGVVHLGRRHHQMIRRVPRLQRHWAGGDSRRIGRHVDREVDHTVNA